MILLSHSVVLVTTNYSVTLFVDRVFQSQVAFDQVGSISKDAKTEAEKSGKPFLSVYLDSEKESLYILKTGNIAGISEPKNMLDCLDIFSPSFLLAEVHTDDDGMGFEFDVSPFFIDLAKNGGMDNVVSQLNEGGYADNELALSFAEFFKETSAKPLFDYIVANSDDPDATSYNCGITAKDFSNWVRHELPNFNHLVESYH